MNKPRYTFVPVEEPYDDNELALLRRIEGIRREYEEVVKPYTDALVRSRACKPTRGYVQVQLLEGEQA